MFDLAGIYPPIVTLFRDDESVAYDKLASNLAKWLAEPLEGIVMPGSNSESVVLTREERVTIWQVCRDGLKGTGKRLIAGTGCESTAETIALTQRAAELGAAAALVLPPFFYLDRCGYYGGRPRRPLLPLGAGRRAEIDALLAQLQARCPMATGA